MNIAVPFDGISALVVGLGSAGIRHLENLRTLGVDKIGGCRSVNRPPFKPVALDDIHIYTDFKTALSFEYDVVIICTPTAHHIQYAIQAANAGCHLYIEKPVSHTLEHLDTLSQLVKDRELTVMVGCQFRYHPHLMLIKRWLEEGKIGQLTYTCVDTGEYLPSWHPWEDYRNSYAARKDLGGGVVLTLIHEIDYLSWLFGSIQPISALGGISSRLDLNVEDHATVFMATSGGAPVVMHMDYLQQPPCRKMKIVGTHGTIHWDYHKKSACEYVDGYLRRRILMPPTWKRNDMFKAAMQDFLECVVTGNTPRVPFKDGIETLRIALQIKEKMFDKVQTIS
jgi:predicted dehydrogenase